MAKSKVQLTSPKYGKTTGGTSSSSKGSTATGTSSGRTLNSKGYDPNVDYSLAIVNAASEAERNQLRQEREAKINDKYGGSDPYQGKNTSTVTGKSTASSVSSASSATRPSSGGSSYGGSGYTAPSPAPAVSTGRNYHQEAQDAAARGDWSAVGKALADRQAKIDAQGGNDRGTSNQQILEQLRQEYGFDSLSGGMQDYVKLNAGMKLPYDTSYGTTGEVYKDKGWQEGVNYLDEAQRLASAGDLEGAYEALMRRGFKLADGGSPSNGGGTSQDQAYALIHQLYNQSPAARDQYLNEVEINRQRLQDHQTQFGLETRPELANRRFVSTDGRYVIYYDAAGTPSYAMPVSSKAGTSSYVKRSPEENALRAQYYNGDENTDFAELGRQIHNINVVRTGVGRLVDQNGSFASGTPVQPVSASDWTGLSQTDRYQDRAALQDILNRINAGTDYSGGSTRVPADERAQYLAALPAGGAGTSGGGYGSYGGGSGGGYSDYGYGGDDLSAYLRQIYESNLNAQLARLRAAYEQNAADYRAHDDLIAQSYRDRQNQAAAQNDLQRMYMAEMGNMQGLNTGAAGQLALAQSASFQNTLADLMSAESRDRAANDLELRKLAAGYQGDMAAAAAQSDSDLAGALYSEYVRQLQAAEAARQAAQQQANWERQFAYQQQQDTLAQQNWQAQWDYSRQAEARDSAYSLAAAMLKNGVLPDGATLAAAGISQDSAASLLQAYQQAAVQKNKTKSSPSAGNGGGGTQDYSGLFNAAYASGTPASYIANNYKKYGFSKSTGLSKEYEDWAGDSGKLNSAIRNVNMALTNGNQEAADGYIKSVWDALSGREREQLQNVLSKYGIQYTR